MKVKITIVIALAIASITEARLLGKNSKKGGSNAGDSGQAPGIPPGTVWPEDESSNVDNRVPGQAGDGDCCNGEAGPQPASGLDSGGNRVGGCDVPESGFKPTFSVGKKAEGFSLNQYITGVPRSFECECNDQCAVQDGTSKICCFKSHYFIGDDNKNIKLCVDLTGITEAAMNGCIVTPEEEPLLLGDPLDLVRPVPTRPDVAADPNK